MVNKNNDMETFINEMMEYPKKIGRKLGGPIDEDLIKLNLDMPHVVMLDIITSSSIKPIMSEIAKKMGTSKAMITYLVDAMEKKGLVERVEDPNDRRILRIHATRAGTDIVSKMHSHHRKSIRSFLGSLSLADRNVFIKAMRVTHEIFDKYDDESGENKLNILK
ncbi:MAG: hypothetical protein A2231_04650 [Candidatus Firestonebacteria bacterium RIFOXYA2_FULL_40_8]|nr:MAG: hypothetical protein A2231_04650 [Candidatus Firestonebacteria bacterium RIFOXYA2_FULL_40_8]